MRPLTESMPKALLPVLGKPFCDWQLALLASQRVERVVYSVGYRGEMLRDHVGDGARFGLEVSWVDDGERPLGTGGALRRALDSRLLDEAFFVLYGDSYLPIEMTRVESAWRHSNQPALMVVLRNEGRWDKSNAVYANGKVVVYDKGRSDSEMAWIDYGLSVLTRDVIAERVPPGAVVDMADVLRDLSQEGLLAGFEAAERFYEAGSPEGLQDLEDYLKAKQSTSD
jgi:NDP-sugar pyrophosphorylase family protein